MSAPAPRPPAPANAPTAPNAPPPPAAWATRAAPVASPAPPGPLAPAAPQATLTAAPPAPQGASGASSASSASGAPPVRAPQARRPPFIPLPPGELPAALPAPLRQRLAAGRRMALPMPAGAGAPGCIMWTHWQPDAAAQAAAAASMAAGTANPAGNAGAAAVASSAAVPAVASTAPLVLLHGGSGSWTHWVRNIAPLLDAGRQVWAVDLPGFGASDPPPGSDADAMIAPLAHSLQSLFAGQPVDMVGFSFGGMVAGMLLAAHPALARRLVLVGAPAMGLPPGSAYTLQAWRHLPDAAAQAAAHRHNLAALMLHEPGHIDDLALQLHVANVWRDRLPRRRLSRMPILAASLPRVPCPVHAIYGAHDVLYAPRFQALAAAFARAAPRFAGLRLIAGAGHWVQYEAPGPFHAALCKALAA